MLKGVRRLARLFSFNRKSKLGRQIIWIDKAKPDLGAGLFLFVAGKIATNKQPYFVQGLNRVHAGFLLRVTSLTPLSIFFSCRPCRVAFFAAGEFEGVGISSSAFPLLMICV